VLSNCTPHHLLTLAMVIPQIDELIPFFDSTEQSVDRILGTFTPWPREPLGCLERCAQIDNSI